MRLHRLRVRLRARTRHHQARRLPLGRADGAEERAVVRHRSEDDGERPLRALVVRRAGPRGAPRPPARDAALLAYARLVLPPKLDGGLRGQRRPDRLPLGGKVFLNASGASGSCARSRDCAGARARGRAESLAIPMRRSSRPSVCRLSETPNSSRSHHARRAGRQRTTPCRSGVGPASSACASATRCSGLSSGALPGASRSTRPLGPSAVEARHPIAHDPKTDAANPSSLRPARAVMDRRQSQKPPRLRRIPAHPRQPPQPVRPAIRPQRNRPRHEEPPSVPHGQSHPTNPRNPPHEAAPASAGMSRRAHLVTQPPSPAHPA